MFDLTELQTTGQGNVPQVVAMPSIVTERPVGGGRASQVDRVAQALAEAGEVPGPQEALGGGSRV